MGPSEIVKAVGSSRDEIVSLASELISVPSPTGREGKIADLIVGKLDDWGLTTETFEIDPDSLSRYYPKEFYRYIFPYEGRPNVIGKIPGTGGGKSLMVNFHLDVVDADPKTWEVPPWEGTLKNGRLFGRGAADMKGGTAAALFAVKTIAASGLRLKGDLIVAGVIEEEGPGNGTLALQARGIRADGCVIPEPTELAIATALVGGIYGIITVQGRSSHSTTYWEGVNAFEKALVVVEGIRRWREKRREKREDPLYSHAPQTSASSPLINIIRTDGANIARIPSSVQVATRATVMPGEDPHRVAAAMEETIRESSQEDPWLREHPPAFIWIVLGGRSYPAAIPHEHPLPASLSDSFSRVCNRKADFRGFVSPADMQHLLNIRPTTPTVMFGPAGIANAHTDNESVAVDDLVTASAVYARFIVDWCGAS
jgi:acetylornithine deacetylase